MNKRIPPYVLIAVVAGAAAYAFLHTDSGPAPSASADTPAPLVADPPETVGGMDMHGSQALPPNHPPIGAGGGAAAPPQGAGALPANDEPAALTWKAPEAWQSAPNPSTMRIATYRVAPVKGDTEGAELSVMRAGGTTDANIERWVGQMQSAGEAKKVEKTVRGLKVTVVEISGTFTGGGMTGAQAASHANWTLLGAIVETKDGSPYFFKMTGASATVRGARPAFDAMIDSLTPS